MRFEWAATLLVSTLVLSSTVAVAGDDVVDDYGILKWINGTKGGFVHPDQAFQVDPESGVTGIFATQDIKKGTILMQVPWSIIIKSDDPDEEGQMCCGTVDAVAREMKKGDESDFAPYANYLNAQPDDHMPSGWSPLGQKLLRELVGGDVKEPFIPPTEPTEWLSLDWYKYCRGSRADKISAKAAMMVVQRSDDTLMIPGYDMYNHRNGKYFNTITTTKHGKHLIVQAGRNIVAGEQLHNSYNKCKECSGRVHGYGTGEILRDYGFLEPMPQRWHYLDQIIEFDLNINVDGNYQLTWSRRGIPRKDDRPGTIVWFDRQIRRLRQLRNVDYKDGNPGMPEREWNLAWEFQKANIVAMTVAKEAIQAVEDGKIDDKQMLAPESALNTSSFDTDEPHFDALAWEFDDLDYAMPTCDNDEIMKFHDHVTIEELKTQYQSLNFAIHPGTGDVVMDLDNIVQISSNYRPQYHEYFVHGSARFVDTIKRVIFIGGGDSMLLHEVLKYPDLELVVGLELDQMVVRKSFKYFKSQPHFDDPRVEWWFGDATKSLLLLSKEYWQSFDLVLVDLSETVMSFSVTAELDVFDALALLLRHEGVMVKNELYMEPMSKVFDNTLALLYDSPVICSQVLIFGSNNVDFMHDEVYDHGVHTLLYKNMHDPDTRHNLLHDYRVNDARSAGKCGDLPEIKELDEQFKSAGVVDIIEAERTSTTLDASVGDTFLHVIKREGFNPVSAPIYEDGQLVIIMQEGYVVARMFPSDKYCNIDVNLWGSFHKLKELSKSLTDALGSERVSKFRVVVGGMYGSQTWKEDSKIIGPQIVQTRNCDVEEHNEIPEISEELITAAFEAAIPLVDANEITAVVVCENSNDCLATKLLKSVEGVRKVVGISNCPSLKADDISSQYDCEIAKAKELKEALGSDRADLFIVDGSSPLELVQVMNSILSKDKTRVSTIKKKNVFMAWSANPKEEEYHKHFLARFLKQHQWDPIGRAEFWMQAGEKAVEFGLVVTEDEKVGYTMEEVEIKMKEPFKKNKDVKIELRGIYGGLFEYHYNFEPHEFLQTDYDDKPGFEQYYEQKPFAHHSIFQLEEAEGKTFNFSKESLNMALQQSLKYTEFKCTTKYAFADGLGEGMVFLCLNPEKGSVVMTWDGRKHVDISYYLSGNAEGENDRFIGAFLHYSDRSLTIALRDNMPRGTGRVINFEKDMMTPDEVKEFYDTLGQRKEEEDEEDDEEDDYEEDYDDEDFDSSRSEL